MNNFEVAEPILNSPFAEPKEHWHIVEGEEPQRIQGRRPAMYFYHNPKARRDSTESSGVGVAIELKLVNRIREQVKAWREEGYPGVTRTTSELLQWWRRDGRERPLFFAQLEAAETIIFLTEARSDFRQGIEIPRDEPSEAQGYTGFLRYACKMATGTGKTTVMGMLAAWSILNKLNDRSDARFSDVVLVVCPNVTIRDRLRELDPARGEASIYRTRDLIPANLLDNLSQGRVIILNWHKLELKSIQQGEVSAKVVKAGVPVKTRETITIGAKKTTARGTRYLTPEDYERQVAAGLLNVRSEERDSSGHLKKVTVEVLRYVESDTAFVKRLLEREVGGKQNILVINDEAHHAYRIRREEPDEFEEETFSDEDEADEFFKEATVWVEGLDRIHKLRGINLCIDLSATPYFLGRVGQATNRPFPWVVSDFGLIEAIESGLVKIPQLAVRDTTGHSIPGYFNIWHWILPQLTPSERGGKKANPKPEAVLKYAHHPIAMLGSLWEETIKEWQADGQDKRPPVFILVCRNTQIAKVIYEWLAENKAPTGIPPAHIEGFRNNGNLHTIRVDSKVAYETDTGEAKSDEARWMRFTLDTVGKTDWPRDEQRRPIYPEDFEELARKLERPLDPPGRDVRCIVSVGMLTEGWDCLDSETEVLTPTGWRGMGQIMPGDLVYSFNRETERLEIVEVLEYGTRSVKPGEKMVRINSQHLDIRVTERHQFHIKYRNPRNHGALSRRMLTVTASQLAQRKSAYALPLAAESADPFPGLPLTDDEIRLVAWFMTDGGFSDHKLAISQSKIYRHDIRELLQKLGLDFTETVVAPSESRYANSKPLHLFRVPKGTHTGALKRDGWHKYSAYLDKAVSPLLHAMTRRQFLVFWEELLKGDGERQGNKSGWLWCDLKEQADAYTQMAIVRGLAASYHPRVTDHGKTVYRVSVRNAQWITSDPGDERASTISVESPRPDEIVWCIRNRNSTLVTRRNGKIAILGNCNTVTHIIGLRPFTSQLLCEQVVGRGLRRVNYDVQQDGKFGEEVAKVFGVPFEIVPFKADKQAAPPPPVQRYHVHAIPTKSKYEILFPRVEGYTQAVRNRITVDWDSVPSLTLEPGRIPPEVELKGALLTNQGRPSLLGPGRLESVSLEAFRARRRLQELIFDLARSLTMEYVNQRQAEIPVHVLFPQLAPIVSRYVEQKVSAHAPADLKDLFLAPYYGWLVERLLEAIHPDSSQGEVPEVPRYEASRGPGSTKDVDFWTKREVREAIKSHVNFVVADTDTWEQSAAYYIDKHPGVESFVKNAGLGFAIPYLHNDQMHDYLPDFIIRLSGMESSHLILETKGYDPLVEVKKAAAERWVRAVNADGRHGKWLYAIARKPADVIDRIDSASERLSNLTELAYN